MNDLRRFTALQSRLYEFLAQQDEATLEGIVSGAVRLAVVSDGDVRTPASPPARERAPLADEPATDPYQAAHDLPRLATQHDRQVYLNASGLSVPQLRQVAKLLGLTRYSGLTKPQLTAFIAGHHQNRAAPAPAEQEIPRPSPMARPAEPTRRAVDAAAIAARLRDIETEDDGAAYLRAQHLDREGLLAIAAELQLTRVDRLKPSELEKRVLKQAIGARRKFAGLRKW